MKSNKRICAILLSLIMVISIVVPNLTSNGYVADAADSSFSVELDASANGDVQAIKAAILSELGISSSKVDDYDFFYEYSFDSMTPSSTFTPAFVLSDASLNEYFGEDSYIADATSDLSTKAVNVIHNKFNNFAKNSSIVKSLAKEYNLSIDALVDAILPAGDAGKAKLEEFFSKKYWSLIDGYEGCGTDGTLSFDSNCTKDDCVAYIPFTVNGAEKTKAFGFCIPAISAGTYNVKVVAIDGSGECEGKVSIAAKSATVAQQNISADGFVTYTGEGVDVLKADCDTLEIYVGIENCDMEAFKKLDSNSENVFASIVLPAGLSDLDVAASYGHENFSANLGQVFNGKTIGDVCDDLDASHPGKGADIKKAIKSALGDDAANIVISANACPSKVGIYAAVGITFDSAYENAYETAIYAIVDDSTTTDKLTFNTEVVDGKLYTTDDLDSSLSSVEADVHNIFLGYTASGNFTDKLSTAKSDALAKVDSQRAQDLISNFCDDLAAGKAPQGSDKALASLVNTYDICNDDDVLVNFVAKIMAAYAENGFDADSFGIYTSIDEVLEAGEGTFLQISYVDFNTDYIVLPIYREFKLVEKDETFDIELNLDKAEVATLDTLQLEIIYTKDGEVIEKPEGAEVEVTWTSSDEDIATVDANGLVTAFKYGKVVITATTNMDKEFTCEIQTRYYDVNGSNVKGDEDYQYYYNPVYWAADNGITKGYAQVHFGPEKDCIRKDYAIFIWRMHGCPAPKGDARRYFNDVDLSFSIKSDSNKAIAWCYENGITKGFPDGGYHPYEAIKRKDAMIMLYRFNGRPKMTAKMKFADVEKLGYKKTSDTYQSIIWGYKNGITAGYSDGTFRPLDSCLREHIITFIYRYCMKF